MTPSSATAFLSIFCLLMLLLPAQRGAASNYASYKLGSRQVFFKTSHGKSSDNSQQASTTTTCSSSTTTGQDNSKIPIVHRQSPCSPLHGLPSLTAAYVLRRDASLIQRRRFSLQSSVAAAPVPSSSAGTRIPINGSWDPALVIPGALDYSVLVSYGTPEQQFPVFLDTTFGTSLIRCKPCASGSNNCDPAFDTARSSTFAHVLCGSPDCPIDCSGGSICPYRNPYSVIQGTFAKDVLTLSPSMAIGDFRFLCQDVDGPSHEFSAAGKLDLSRHDNSLPSRLSSSSPFSYCLPPSASSEGFLHLGGDVTAREDNVTVHAPLVSSKVPELGSLYFIDLVGMSLGDEDDLPIPAATLGSHAGANLDVGTTFTLLAPDAYTAVRDSFRRQMSQYDHLSLPGLDGFDTCYNFTGLDELTIPLVGFKFSNSQTLVIDNGMLYYHDPNVGPFTVACLAFSALNNAAADDYSAVIGASTLVSMEVVYDVAGGKVGFIPFSC